MHLIFKVNSKFSPDQQKNMILYGEAHLLFIWHLFGLQIAKLADGWLEQIFLYAPIWLVIESA